MAAGSCATAQRPRGRVNSNRLECGRRRAWCSHWRRHLRARWSGRARAAALRAVALRRAAPRRAAKPRALFADVGHALGAPRRCAPRAKTDTRCCMDGASRAVRGARPVTARAQAPATCARPDLCWSRAVRGPAARHVQRAARAAPARRTPRAARPVCSDMPSNWRPSATTTPCAAIPTSVLVYSAPVSQRGGTRWAR